MKIKLTQTQPPYSRVPKMDVTTDSDFLKGWLLVSVISDWFVRMKGCNDWGLSKKRDLWEYKFILPSISFGQRYNPKERNKDHNYLVSLIYLAIQLSFEGLYPIGSFSQIVN